MKKFLAFSLVIFSLMSCSATSDSSTSVIIGKWDWVQSSGGIIGATTTPKSTNKTMSIDISKSEIKWYENGNLTATDAYSIQTKESILGGKQQMLVYSSGRPSQSFSVDGNKLFMSDECNDCYRSEYVKQ